MAEHAPEALQALLEWHVEAYSCMEYGTEPKRATKAKRLFDMEQDMAIIYCDFMRLYRIDLSEWEGPWQGFTALLMGAMRTEGSLLSTAIMARSPIPASIKGQERKQLLARQEAWSLPLTEDELVERMKRIF